MQFLEPDLQIINAYCKPTKAHMRTVEWLLFLRLLSKGREVTTCLHDSTSNRIWIVCADQLTVFHNSLYHDTTHDAQLQVCQGSDQAYCGVMFRDENINLLAKLHLRFPSPTMDRQVNHLFCFILRDEKD